MDLEVLREGAESISERPWEVERSTRKGKRARSTIIIKRVTETENKPKQRIAHTDRFVCTELKTWSEPRLEQVWPKRLTGSWEDKSNDCTEDILPCKQQAQRQVHTLNKSTRSETEPQLRNKTTHTLEWGLPRETSLIRPDWCWPLDASCWPASVASALAVASQIDLALSCPVFGTQSTRHTVSRWRQLEQCVQGIHQHYSNRFEHFESGVLGLYLHDQAFHKVRIKLRTKFTVCLQCHWL